MRTAILAALLLAAPTSAHAGDLVGKVYDPTALPVAGALVAVAGHEVVTAADGSYHIAGLDAGTHEVAVRLADGAVQRVSAEVGAEGTARRNVFLVTAAALRGARAFVGEAASAPAADLPQLPASEGAVAVWRWRDSDA